MAPRTSTAGSLPGSTPSLAADEARTGPPDSNRLIPKLLGCSASAWRTFPSAFARSAGSRLAQPASAERAVLSRRTDVCRDPVHGWCPRGPLEGRSVRGRLGPANRELVC